MNFVLAFVVGGIICVIGQLMIDVGKLTPAKVLVSFVVAGVILSFLGIYEVLADFAGAGASVPLLGFGHLLAQGVIDAIKEKGIFGIITGGFIACAGGVTATIVCAFVAALISKSKDQN